MIVRRSTLSDLPRLMEIYREARSIQLESGNLHQWYEGFPPEDLIRSDIERGVGYAVVDEAASGDADIVVGVFALVPGDDPTYSQIEGGEWLDDGSPYLTIHRLGSLKSSHGVAKVCFDWCSAQSDNLRVDTHADNAIMRHCIEKAGFTYCGVIHLLNGDPRLAYQKVARI